MIDRRVVDHQIDDDANAEGVRVIGKGDEIAKRAMFIVDAVVIADVVPVVTIW
jgi:hypothetical protein